MTYTGNYSQVVKYQMITKHESERWSYYLKRSIDYDVFHTLHYHDLDMGGEPVLFVYEEGENFVGFPLLRRKIEHSDYCDFTSSYGYSGPISNKAFNSLSDDFVENFKYAFVDFMQNNKAVSVFCRLNPFLNQSSLLNKIDNVRNNGRTIYMDLTESLDVQIARYNKRLSRQLRQLRRFGYVLKEAKTELEIQHFTKMYHKNMIRVDASQRYFYSEDYFTSLIESQEFNTKLLLMYDGDKIVCGAVVLWGNGIIRNHLSATHESYISLSPSKLMTDEISKLGRELGMKYLHLGGGVGGKEDTLFNFKLSFSNLVLQDNIWCFISDHSAYDQLVTQKNITSNMAYFPLYRSV